MPFKDNDEFDESASFFFKDKRGASLKDPIKIFFCFLILPLTFSSLDTSLLSSIAQIIISGEKGGP